MELRLSLSGERPVEPLRRRFRSVGLIRSEYLLREREQFVTVPQCQERITSYVVAVATAFAEGEVWYRTTELTTEEANTLAGVDRVYHESDFMKGRRGVRRALDNPDSLLTELEVVADVARDHRNLHVIVPFVRDIDDFGFAVDLLDKVSWPNRVGTMVEIPSAINAIGDFRAAGATNLLVGLNDLTALLVGTTREAGDMKHHPSVWNAIDQIAAAAGDTDWGIAGNLSTRVLHRAGQAGAPYASLHYNELPDLIDTPAEQLPDRWHVLPTRSQITAATARATLADCCMERSW